MLPKESPTPKKGATGHNYFGTGLSSTLLSSQRTTTHRSSTSVKRRSSGQPRHFTRSTSSAQDLSPAEIRESLVDIAQVFPAQTHTAKCESRRDGPADRPMIVGIRRSGRDPSARLLPAFILYPVDFAGANPASPVPSVSLARISGSYRATRSATFAPLRPGFPQADGNLRHASPATQIDACLQVRAASLCAVSE
jgi:hypothetical protein